MKRLFFDIETTGLSKERDVITVIGAYDGKNVTQLVRGINLTQENVEKLFCCDEVIGFNSKRFDAPFINYHYGFPEVDHTDLMYSGWEVGWKGGLKAIERRIGISRDSGVSDGREALYLWRDYQLGNKEALKKLLAYNAEDVVNLLLVEKAIKKEKFPAR